MTGCFRSLKTVQQLLLSARRIFNRQPTTKKTTTTPTATSCPPCAQDRQWLRIKYLLESHGFASVGSQNRQAAAKHQLTISYSSGAQAAQGALNTSPPHPTFTVDCSQGKPRKHRTSPLRQFGRTWLPMHLPATC